MRLKSPPDANLCPEIVPIVSKCAELIVNHTFISYILLIHCNQPRLNANGSDCLQISLISPNSLGNSLTSKLTYFNLLMFVLNCYLTFS